MPTIIVQVGNKFFSKKVDGTYWQTTISPPMSSPDFSKATEVTLGTSGSIGYVAVRNSIENAIRVARNLEIDPIELIDGSQPPVPQFPQPASG